MIINLNLMHKDELKTLHIKKFSILDKKNCRSLFMCSTPLQLLIAEKIIKLNPNKSFDLILVVKGAFNEKYSHYYHAVSKLCCKTLVFNRNSSDFKTFIKFVKTVKDLNMNEDYEALYVANINSRYFQYIVSKNTNANLYTFDDGIANITSFFFNSSDFKASKIKKIFWHMAGIKYFTNDLIDKSLLHYTLYPNIPNTIALTEPIKLVDNAQINFSEIPQKSSEIVKFFLGQPLEGISSEYTNDYIKNCLLKLGIDYYFQHPKETYSLDKEFNVIKTPLIFEDFIVNYINSNPSMRVEIYSFNSSAILNISSIKNISLFYIYDEIMYKLYKNFYDLVWQKFKIPCLKID